MRTGLVPGHNVDRIDVAAGLRELVACGYPAAARAATTGRKEGE